MSLNTEATKEYGSELVFIPKFERIVELPSRFCRWLRMSENNFQKTFLSVLLLVVIRSTHNACIYLYNFAPVSYICRCFRFFVSTLRCPLLYFQLCVYNLVMYYTGGLELLVIKILKIHCEDGLKSNCIIIQFSIVYYFCREL